MRMRPKTKAIENLRGRESGSNAFPAPKGVGVYYHLFLYNELKLGRKFHMWLRRFDPIFAGSARVDGYALWSIGNTFPAAVADKNRSVFGELWVVSEELLRRLDKFEEVFQRQMVRIHPLQGVFETQDPLLGEMYVWTKSRGANDSLRKAGVW